MPIRRLREFFLQREKETEFDVQTGDFGDLEIRQGDQPNFFYFYDAKGQRLIKSFILREGPQVDTMCGVVLIKKDEGYTPRLTLWKKEKTKGKREDLTEEQLVAEGRTVLIKARVDVGDCQEEFWKLIHFLQTYRGV